MQNLKCRQVLSGRGHRRVGPQERKERAESARKSCMENAVDPGSLLGVDPRCQGQWEAGNAIPLQPVNPLHCS